MRYLFAKHSHDVLSELASARVLVAFDFDGTLAPIVASRERAGMRARTRALFERTCTHYPTAVITGRSCADVAARLPGRGVKYLVGNHGLEPGKNLRRFAREIAAAERVLTRVLTRERGIEIENKRYSLAVHYRSAQSSPAHARAAVSAAVMALGQPLRVIAGKQVVNVVPEAAPNKGDALLELRARARARVAIYVGDDVTDEDVFVIGVRRGVVGVRVGVSRGSAASYYLRDQCEVDYLLRRLCSLRE